MPPPPPPDERRDAGRLARIMAIVAGAAILIMFLVIVFRGCHDAGPGARDANPHTQPLPGTEDATGTRTGAALQTSNPDDGGTLLY
jgi:hypothetical protein